MKSSPFTVLVVGGFPLSREGVSARLRMHPGFAVVGESMGEKDARKRCEELAPDLIVLDMEPFDGRGAWSLLGDFRRLQPGVRVVALSEREETEWMQRSFRAGAQAYVSKQEPGSVVVSALEWMCWTEEPFMGPRMRGDSLRDVASGKLRAAESEVGKLSNRELEVFGLLGTFPGVATAAHELGVSVKTIESHIERIKQKLGVRTTPELRRRAMAWLSARATPGAGETPAGPARSQRLSPSLPA